MNPPANDVLAALTDEALLRAARRNQRLTARTGQPEVSDTDILTVLHGFMSMVSEAAEAKETKNEALFLDTVVPAALAQGQGLATIVNNTVTFGIVLADEVARRVPAERREAALEWLAGFYGRYVSQSVRKAVNL